jgi:DNA-binding NtrC family response regulator
MLSSTRRRIATDVPSIEPGELLTPSMRRFAALVAATDEPILLTGETGGGKTHLARLIHRLSRRRAERIVDVNCSAVPDALFEREMFGHVRGSFTDAKESRVGLVEAAHRGTLFLDEIGDMPVASQPKLLAVLEEGRVRRIGAVEPTEVDVRLVSATNAELESRVTARTFRADLYHRLAVLTFHVPPLRERADLPEIVQRLLERLVASSETTTEVAIEDEAMACLLAYAWPGNLRELENALRAALVLADGRPIRRAHLPATVRGARCTRPSGAHQPASERRQRYCACANEEVERTHILEVLDSVGGNKTKAARRLGMSRSSLWAKLKRYEAASIS